MNKNYTKALINEMFDQKILNSEDDRARIKELIAMCDGDFTGSFEDDLEILKEIWEEDQEDDEVAPKSVEEEVEEIVSQLHVGSNVIPVLGIAFAHNEEDLENLKNYLRGWLTAHFTLKRIFEDWA